MPTSNQKPHNPWTCHFLISVLVQHRRWQSSLGFGPLFSQSGNPYFQTRFTRATSRLIKCFGQKLPSSILQSCANVIHKKCSHVFETFILCKWNAGVIMDPKCKASKKVHQVEMLTVGSRLVRQSFRSLRSGSSWQLGRLPSKDEHIVMGAVSYDPAISTIWEKMKYYLNSAGCPFDFVLFTNYERQVAALLAGDVDIAWNGPVAHVLAQQHAGLPCMLFMFFMFFHLQNVQHAARFFHLRGVLSQH